MPCKLGTEGQCNCLENAIGRTPRVQEYAVSMWAWAVMYFHFTEAIGKKVPIRNYSGARFCITPKLAQLRYIHSTLWGLLLVQFGGKIKWIPLLVQIWLLQLDRGHSVEHRGNTSHMKSTLCKVVGNQNFNLCLNSQYSLVTVCIVTF